MEMGPKWYITRGQQRIGPVDASQLKHMAMTEQLAPTEYVWKEGMATWVQAQQVQGLFDRPVEDEPEAVREETRAEIREEVRSEPNPYGTPFHSQPSVKAPEPEKKPGAEKPQASSAGTEKAPAKPTEKPVEKPVEKSETSPASSGAAARASAASNWAASPSPAAPSPGATAGSPAVHSTTAAIPTPKPAENKPTAPAASTPTPASAPVRPTPALAARPVIRPTTPLPALSSPSKKRDAFVPILGSILMLITLLLPWGSGTEYAYGPKKTLFAWHVIGNAFATGGTPALGLWMIVSWTTALLTVILSFLLTGIPRAIVYTLLGTIAGVFFAIAAFSIGLTEGPFKSGASEAQAPLAVIFAVLVFLTLIVVHLNRRGGPNGPLRIVQLVSASALALVTIILFILAFAAANSTWSQYGSWRVKSPWGNLLRINLLLTHLGTIFACVMLILNAIGGAKRTAVSLFGLVVLYLITLLSVHADAYFTAGAFAQWDSVLAANWAIFLMLGTALILGSGIVLLIDHLRKQSAPITTVPVT